LPKVLVNHLEFLVVNNAMISSIRW